MSEEQRAAHVMTISNVGRTVDLVKCSCGRVNRFYRWSWAGHGKARCTACRAWISYYGLRVMPDTKEKGAP